MTDLSDEVKASFDSSRSDVTGDDESPVQIITGPTDDMPGFAAMRDYYGVRLQSVTRRGYRHFAGSTLTRNADELLDQTSKVMAPYLIAIMIQSFCDGVMVGQKSEIVVKLALHFHREEHLFNDEEFRRYANTMAVGFTDDNDVLRYFGEYLEGAIANLTHVCGFAHHEVEPGKVWDIWMLAGTAVVSATYLAGQKLGTSWLERDVLDGIVIATEEGNRGSERQADDDGGPDEDHQE